MSGHLTLLPTANRKSSTVNFITIFSVKIVYMFVQIPPPVVSSSDARRGLMSLLERGFIPVIISLTISINYIFLQPATDIQLNPPPFVPQQVQLHEQDSAKARSASDKRIAENKDSKSLQYFHLIIVKHSIAAARWATVKVLSL